MDLLGFYECFKEKIKLDIKDNYHGGNFSGYIFPKIESVLKENRYGCFYEKEEENEKLYQKEYYKIDIIGWTQYSESEELKDIFEKNKIEGKFNKHFWSLDIAIEHENSNKDWMDEVIKLCYINCPLRIVISYVDRKNGDYEDDKLFLKTIAESLDLLDKDGKKQILKENDEFGIILGSKALEQVPINDNYQLYKLIREDNKYVILQYDNEMHKWNYI